MKQLTQAQAAYTAAMIDGEGALTCVPMTDRWHRAPYVACRVSISNSCKEMLQAIQSWTGVGHVHDMPRQQRWLPVWTLNIRKHEDVASLLAEVLPYLIVKRERAELVLCYVSSRLIRAEEDHNGFGHYASLDDYELGIAKEVTRLNVSGRRPGQYGKWKRVELKQN